MKLGIIIASISFSLLMLGGALSFLLIQDNERGNMEMFAKTAYNNQVIAKVVEKSEAVTRSKGEAVTRPKEEAPAPAPAPSTEEKTGSLTRKEIQKVVSSKNKQIKYCYEKELLKNPKLAGKITASWTVDLNGKVKSVSIEKTSLQNKNLHECMIKTIKKWRFPKPKGNGYVTIKYPFNFTSK